MHQLGDQAGYAPSFKRPETFAGPPPPPNVNQSNDIKINVHGVKSPEDFAKKAGQALTGFMDKQLQSAHASQFTGAAEEGDD